MPKSSKAVQGSHLAEQCGHAVGMAHLQKLPVGGAAEAVLLDLLLEVGLGTYQLRRVAVAGDGGGPVMRHHHVHLLSQLHTCTCKPLQELVVLHHQFARAHRKVLNH